jgi:hypothetical protein
MALTPPAYGFAAIDLGPELGISAGRSEGGLVITSRRGDPYVTGKLTTRELKPAQFADFHAFLLDAADRVERVDIVNPRFRLPRAYSNGTWPLASDPALAAVTNLRTISVAGLQVGMQLKRGDRLCLIQSVGGSEVVSYRWLSADCAVASALTQALSITPRLPIGVFSAGAAVRFKDPFARVTVIADSIEAAITSDSLAAISFEVEEALR